MQQRYIEPNDQAAAALFSKNHAGPVVMLNLLQLKDVADYSANPQLAPATTLSGQQAFNKYVEHTTPFLNASGGKMLFLGKSDQFLIGPENEHWDVVMLIRQNSLADFLGFASNEEYLEGLGHRTAAVLDSRLLPVFPDGAGAVDS